MPVYQLETAMGSAIEVFEEAAAIRVPRTRFAPVKKTEDLLAVRSDAYVLTPDNRVVLAPERGGTPPTVELVGDGYRFVNDLDVRFPSGAPSLRRCDRLVVEGEFRFGRGIILRGDVRFRNTNGKCKIVPDGLVLEDGEWPDK